ncbi:MAG: hypothetical protein JO162_16005 [Alphaproteobacteria bacterium]|nr:hypothetical protein [Alphaproteobacteria bacterium]
MNDSPRLTASKRQEQAERDKRLARALRQNLHRRKQQARAKGQRETPSAGDRETEDPPA